MTPESIRWHEQRELYKRQPSKEPPSFKNSALTVDGELCIGMTHNKSVGYYACTYTELNGVRDFGGSRRWSLKGEAEDGGSDLLIDTVQLGIHTI
ncbi:hypothetical protein [Pseudoalteromonas phage vB_PalP_Y7]|nr:hypothetical protein [Pseudoalteromonas phage vB_PalP_Y7]